MRAGWTWSVLLDELKIVVMPQLDEAEIESAWHVEPGLPLVWASRSSLMQVFLNIVANSVRALASRAVRSLSISARCEGAQVIVEVRDNGGGVAHPEHLFRPFQAEAEATGLGLYLSGFHAVVWGRASLPGDRWWRVLHC